MPHPTKRHRKVKTPKERLNYTLGTAESNHEPNAPQNLSADPDIQITSLKPKDLKNISTDNSEVHTNHKD